MFTHISISPKQLKATAYKLSKITTQKQSTLIECLSNSLGFNTYNAFLGQFNNSPYSIHCAEVVSLIERTAVQYELSLQKCLKVFFGTLSLFRVEFQKYITHCYILDVAINDQLTMAGIEILSLAHNKPLAEKYEVIWVLQDILDLIHGFVSKGDISESLDWLPSKEFYLKEFCEKYPQSARVISYSSCETHHEEIINSIKKILKDNKKLTS